MKSPEPHILTTPQQIELYHLFTLKHALKLEIRTGLRHSRGSVKRQIELTLERAGKIQPNQRFTRKQSALDALEAYIDEKTRHLTEDPA